MAPNMFDWKVALQSENWAEGRIISLADGSYRHRIMVVCYTDGRQRARFANGEHSFGAYAELVRPNGSRITQGANVVPVLPDGRLIMVVEQRPPQEGHCVDGFIEFVNGERLALSDFGPYSSLEFPGGAVDQDEKFTSAFLRELQEETEVHDQDAVLYQRVPLFFPMGSDVAVSMQVGVIKLTHLGFQGFVKNDGGLHTLALTPEEVMMNIWKGIIVAGQAALLPWYFYRELEEALNGSVAPSLIEMGYIEIKKVRIDLNRR